MNASLVYDGSHPSSEMPTVPPLLYPKGGAPIPPHQMQGKTAAERVIEIAGRGCYDSFGSGRPTKEYLRNLILEQKHGSVLEHVHFTLLVDRELPVGLFLGVPDCSFHEVVGGALRCTFNLRHAFEFPNNLTCRSDFDPHWGAYKQRWANVFRAVLGCLLPSVYEPLDEDEPWHFSAPQTDTEAHVTLFLEDSLVWSHEMVRHRFNMSQRSGRFVDQTDRDVCTHPLTRDYLDESGNFSFEDEEFKQRRALGQAIGSLIAQSRLVYDMAVNQLQPYAADKLNLDKTPARKQARSAARYYLPNGLSTEMTFTASIRSWRGIFAQRVNPKADLAIYELMGAAKSLVSNSRYGHLL